MDPVFDGLVEPANVRPARPVPVDSLIADPLRHRPSLKETGRTATAGLPGRDCLQQDHQWSGGLPLEVLTGWQRDAGGNPVPLAGGPACCLNPSESADRHRTVVECRATSRVHSDGDNWPTVQSPVAGPA